MTLRPNMEPREYLAIINRRKWLIIFPALFIMLGASFYCVVAPEQYKSSTTILVVPQRVPENYVRSTVGVRIEERLATIQQQVMSRTRLMTIIDELGLFREERKKYPSESLVALMQKRIDVNVRGNDAFTLSFVHENRHMAMFTAARLASLFIDENLKTREQQAVGTSEFLESQLQETKEKLEAAEEKVRIFKTRFGGELPQETATNISMLNRLQDQMRMNSEAIRAAEDRKVLMETQAVAIERSSAIVVSDNGVVEPAPPADPAQHLLTDLAARKARLADLSARYTDKYPELRRVRTEVSQIEKQIEEIRKGTPPTDPSPGRSPAVRPRTASGLGDNREIARLRAQAVSTQSEIANLRKEREAIQKQVETVQAKVERSPAREQEMIAITRDYDNLKRTYDELMRNKLHADIAQNLEKRQKGEQFQILDPANLPESPFRPNRKQVLAIAFLAACIVGFGGAIALEMFDQTLRGENDFRHHFGIPVLASIPLIQDEKFNRGKLMRRAAVLWGIALFTMTLSVFLLRYSGKIRTILHF